MPFFKEVEFSHTSEDIYTHNKGRLKRKPITLSTETPNTLVFNFSNSAKQSLNAVISAYHKLNE